MRVLDLGVPRIAVEGGEIESAGPKQTALLSLLILEAGRRVSTNELLVAGWGYDADVPVSALENHVWRLRRVLEPLRQADGSPIIVTDQGGYRLVVDRESLDSAQFEELAEVAADALRDGRFAAALDACENALPLWRGAPFEAIAHLDQAAAAIARLEELHSQVLEARIDALVGEGDDGRALAELQRLVRAHPFRESLRAKQMRVLQRLGRTHEALDVFLSARMLLVDELGIEPGIELQSLQRDILNASDQIVPEQVVVPVSPPPVPAARVHLPVRTSKLFGRSAEIDRLDDLIRERALVTIVGPGGVGKTRLAINAAQRWADSFRDGVWFIDLTEVGQPSLVADAIVSTLGLTPMQAPAGATSAAAVLQGYLPGRRLLLVLDNCEHVIAGVRPLLNLAASVQGNGLTVIATSREPLRCDDEAVLALQPLPLTGDGASAGASPAAALFLDRMEAPARSLDSGDLRTIEEICTAVDGLPLAIELAAARFGTFTLSEIANQVVDDPGRLSQLGHGDAAHRSTLWSTIEWSHRLLTPAEQAVHRRLAVLSGPFTLNAAVAAASAPDLPAGEVPGVLAALVHQSLLRAGPPRAPGRPSVFQQLDTVRAHARRHLAEVGEADEIAARRDAWVVRLLSERPRLGEPAVARWYDALDDNVAAVRATLNSAAARETFDPEFLRAMVGLPLYWYHRERLIEARRWLSSAARLLPLDAAGAEPTEVTIFRIVRLATEIASGEQDGPRRDLDAVLAHARAVPASDLVDVGESLVAAGYAAWAVNAYDLALPIAAALAEVAGLSEDPRLVLQAAQVDCLAGLGGTRSDAEIAARSESLYERAVAADDLLVQWGAAGVRSVISHRLRDVSGVVWVDRLIPAHAHFGQGGGGSFIESLATFADALGDDETAVRMFAASEADLRRVGIPWPGFWGTSDRLARLRTTIAPSRFDELWREGASLTYEQIGLERGLLVGPHSPPDQQA